MTSESSALQHTGESLSDVTDAQEGLVIAPDGKDPARPHPARWLCGDAAAGGAQIVTRAEDVTMWSFIFKNHTKMLYCLKYETFIS